MTAHKVRSAVAVLAVVLTLVSCARTSIEEQGRRAIRDKAAEAMDIFTFITTAVDPADRSELKRRLTGSLPSTYSLTWTADGVLVNDLYLREHLTTSGGLFGEQRTVSACVRYTFDKGNRTMRSIHCPSTGPQSEYTDEQVTVPGPAR
jgi:hypothetical protein